VQPETVARGPSALVIGLDGITGLQTSRILARRGVRVVGIAADGRHPACRTNTCPRVVVAPTEGDGLLAALDHLAVSERGALLFPCTDASVRTLVDAPERLDAFLAVLPSSEAVDILMDTQRLWEFAASRSLPMTPTRIVHDLADADRAAADLRFPCVVEPSLRHPRWEASGPKLRRFADARAWSAAAGGLLELDPDLVVRQCPPDEGRSYSCDFYVSPKGMPILTFVSRTLRRWPPLAGTSSLVEAVNDLAVRDLALDVVSNLPIIGLGHVEVGRDPATGADHLIRVSAGGPTRQSAIAEAGGVELLYTMYRDAVGAPLPVGRLQRDHAVRWVHLVLDLRSALRHLGTGALTPLDWLRSMRGAKVSPDVDLSDLRPSFSGIARGIGRLRQRSGV
jgi:D-aspartate ligase